MSSETWLWHIGYGYFNIRALNLVRDFLQLWRVKVCESCLVNLPRAQANFAKEKVGRG